MEGEEGEQDPSFPLASSSADKALATGVLNDTVHTAIKRNCLELLWRLSLLGPLWRQGGLFGQDWCRIAYLEVLFCWE